MEQVKNLGNGSTHCPKGPKIKLPNGYYTLTDVSKHVRKLVDEQWPRVKAAHQLDLVCEEVKFKEALINFLLEYLIWQFDVNTKNLDNRKTCLWQDGKLISFDTDGDIFPSHGNGLPLLREILFKSDYAELDFYGRGGIPFVFSSAEDRTNFEDYISTLKTGYDFVDAQKWSLLPEPKPEPHLALELADAEREIRQDCWERIKPFSGAVFVCAGRSASKIADRTKPELKKFFGTITLPNSKEWERDVVEYAEDEKFVGLSSEELAEFHIKPKQTFAKWISGNSQAASHRNVTRMWESFQKLLFQKHGIKVGGRGRRTKK